MQVWCFLVQVYQCGNDIFPAYTVNDKLPGSLEKLPCFLNGFSLKELRTCRNKRSYTEQLLLVFFKQTKLRYNKLSEEEKQWLIRIMQKSELIKSAVSKRGKRKK